jgi:putative membrane protein
MLLHLAALAGTVLLLSRAVPGVHIRSAGTAIAVAIVFSLLNFFLGWAIRAVLFVPALLTLGVLFFFVPLIVNTLVLWLTDKAMESFEIETPTALLVSSLAITLVNGAFHMHSAWSLSMGHPGFGGPRWI